MASSNVKTMIFVIAMARMVKERALDDYIRVLCHSRLTCPNLDGYCPSYECGNVDKLHRYSERQWCNAIVDIGSSPACPDNFADFVSEVCELILTRRPSKHGKK